MSVAAVHWGRLGEVLTELSALPAPEPDLAAWATRTGTPDGAFPLLGASTRAETYVALLWNGERCRRAGLGLDAGLTLVGLAVGAEHGRSAAELSDALADVLAARASVAAPPSPVAGLSTDVLAAAALAARLAGVPAAQEPALLDLAASLMVITPPGPSAEPVAGHALAAGWLALRARQAGIAGMAGGLAHTLAVVSGTPAPFDRAPSDVELSAIVGALS
ncbi:hypothetical protein ACQP2P_15045 [Dactylosporangium sp. CA-139114]|uniref:hypothetical protein n=1 Tax=Dactylosporangium sp. CA-139114 TaxID=3239931 RepID=UPI003D9659F9